jgi:arylsulfatase A-like enzyme
MKTTRLLFFSLGSVMLSLAGFAAADKPSNQSNPAVLAQEPRWPPSAQAPKGAPNVVLILLDDAGFAAPGTFGGPSQTPTLQALAAEGLRYTNFNTPALCSPTRAALLSGRNPHRVGFGTVAEGARPYAGYNATWPKSAASVAQVLRDNGYSTAAFGKWHNTPEWEISPVGPFDRWPTGLGFEYFYGFMSGETSEWEPVLYRNTTLVHRTAAKGYYLTIDLTDKSIEWLHTHQSLAPDKPFFLYFAPGATHAPQHVPKEWIEKYRGKFAEGWDKLRQEIFARQKALGVVPPDAALTDRPDGIPAWDTLSPMIKNIAERQMEVYAGYLAEADYEVGRLLDAVRQMPNGNNTLVFYIAGDNGADALAGIEGSENYIAQLIYGISPPTNDVIADLKDLGGPRFDNLYSRGWAWAMDTPFKGAKGDSSHFGGTRQGMVVSWPSHINDHGGRRGQFTYATDITPTIYEAAGIEAPKMVEGAEQMPLDGTSIGYTFSSAQTPARHRVQYFETIGNRSIYESGWAAAATHWMPWDGHAPSSEFSDDKWELYDVENDFTEAHDLATRYPERLERLKKLFEAEAQLNNVYPLGNAFSNGRFAGSPKPSLTEGRSVFTYFPAADALPVSAAPNLTRNHRITVALNVPAKGRVEGTIFAIGSRMGGIALYAKNGRLFYENNFFGFKHTTISAMQPLPEGEDKIVFELTRDDEQRGGGGWGRLSVNGRRLDERHIDHIGWSALFGALEVGATSVSPVSDAYQVPFKFTGVIDRVTIELQ